MTARKCRRTWEVEAARDGRITGDALVAFEEHSRTCDACAGEARQLDAIIRELDTATSGEGMDDELSLRREREKLLERADVELRRRASGPSLSRGRVALAIGAAAVVVAGAVLWLRHAPASVEMASVHASADAKWERRRTADGERIDLWAGGLDIEVLRTASDPPFTVRVPDGEIVDEGTTFHVTVRGGETAELAVHAGSVVFRRDGKADVRVLSGSVWSPSAEITPASSAANVERVESPPPEPPPRASGGVKKGHSTAQVTPTPLDEDVAYLRIVALRREGRSDEARVAAAEYLRRFPHGFRRADVVKFAEAQASH